MINSAANPTEVALLPYTENIVKMKDAVRISMPNVMEL